MAATHIDRVNVTEQAGEWIIGRTARGWAVSPEIMHYHEKSKLVWEIVEALGHEEAVCEACVKIVPPGVWFLFRTLKLRQAVEPS